MQSSQFTMKDDSKTGCMFCWRIYLHYRHKIHLQWLSDQFFASGIVVHPILVSGDLFMMHGCYVEWFHSNEGSIPDIPNEHI